MNGDASSRKLHPWFQLMWRPFLLLVFVLQFCGETSKRVEKNVTQIMSRHNPKYNVDKIRQPKRPWVTQKHFSEAICWRFAFHNATSASLPDHFHCLVLPPVACLPHFCLPLLPPSSSGTVAKAHCSFHCSWLSPCFCGQTSAVRLPVPGSGTYLTFSKQHAKRVRTQNKYNFGINIQLHLNFYSFPLRACLKIWLYMEQMTIQWNKLV